MNIFLNIAHKQVDYNLLSYKPLDCKPILGSNKVPVNVSDLGVPLEKIKKLAHKSRMKTYEYLSTLVNLNFAKEYSHQEVAMRKFGGQREVPIKGCGRIDLINSHTIYEVKCVPQWKSALGQVLAYAHYYPNHKRAIVLFERGKSTYSDSTIIGVCKTYGVEVYFI